MASLPLFLTALAIVLVSWLVARLLRDAKFVYRLASRRELLQNLLRQSMFGAVLAAGVVGALHFLQAGALIGTIVGAAGRRALPVTGVTSARTMSAPVAVDAISLDRMANAYRWAPPAARAPSRVSPVNEIAPPRFARMDASTGSAPAG